MKHGVVRWQSQQTVRLKFQPFFWVNHQSGTSANNQSGIIGVDIHSFHMFFYSKPIKRLSKNKSQSASTTAKARFDLTCGRFLTWDLPIVHVMDGPMVTVVFPDETKTGAGQTALGAIADPRRHDVPRHPQVEQRVASNMTGWTMHPMWLQYPEKSVVIRGEAKKKTAGDFAMKHEGIM